MAGLTTAQALEIVRGLKGLNLIGGDLVEVSNGSQKLLQLYYYQLQAIPITYLAFWPSVGL